MQSPRQEYYSSLAGFREYFHTGTPVLMYHKVGVRPAGARFRALYVGTSHFRRQLAGLKAAGFTSAGIGECLEANANPPRVVITFDDGFQSVLEHALEPLAANSFRAIQFLVAGLPGGTNEWDRPAGEVQERLMDATQVREWLAAGHEIGAHSMTHPHLDRIPAERAREEIFASRKKLEDTFGIPVRHFCYPYGHYNRQVRDLVEEAGYLTACTTERGINTAATPRFEITRWLAREPGLRPKEVLARFLDRVLTRGVKPLINSVVQLP